MKIFFPSGAFDDLETNDLIWMNDTYQETNATWAFIVDENNSTELDTNDLTWMNDTSQEKNVTWTYIVEENKSTEIETTELIWANDTQEDYNSTWMYIKEDNSTSFEEDPDYFDELDKNLNLTEKIDYHSSERKKGL